MGDLIERFFCGIVKCARKFGHERVKTCINAALPCLLISLKLSTATLVSTPYHVVTKQNFSKKTKKRKMK